MFTASPSSCAASAAVRPSCWARLSPRTRNAQVALYQSGEVDFLVATDAIGMGLNMDVDHVAFAG
jgi:superfamily II DNA/RNA helicase